MYRHSIDSKYLLDSELAEELYGQVKDLPVVDYYTRLDPAVLQRDQHFTGLGPLFFNPDPLRISINSEIDEEKAFKEWVKSLQFQILHPLYSQTHLELFQNWGIEEFVTPSNAGDVYRKIKDQLGTALYKPSTFIKKYHLKSLFLPMDLLEALPNKDTFAHIPAEVFPVFSPIQVLIVDNSRDFNSYLNSLSEVTGFHLDHYVDLLNALHHSMDLFSLAGCKMAHHRLELMYAEDFTQEEVNFIFHKIRHGHELLPVEKAKYRSALLFHLSEMYFERGWIQQFYLGTIRKLRGQETGFDAMGDDETAWYLLRYLHEFSGSDKLPKTIFYHPNKSSLIASIATKFNQKWGKGWVQARPSWEHLTSMAQLDRSFQEINFPDLLRHFAGMPSCAYTFPSLGRHDFFKRRMSSFLAREAESGFFSANVAQLLPLLRKIVSEGPLAYFEEKP
ncbi:MAG: glucuronate isomerase [Bacteroidia bacterium]|nr:glucuronate isomerase [Bacteroidia bacterium]